MTRWIVLVGAFTLALGGLLLLAIAQRGNPEIAIEPNVVYGKGGDTDLLLDLAMPKTADGPLPAVMFLHGRGWREGGRHDMSHFIEGMAGLGYVGVAIDYRLVPAARFPAQVEDCKAAVRWLRANAAKYRVDADHIGVVGFSAAGHDAPPFLFFHGSEDELVTVDQSQRMADKLKTRR